MCSDRSVPAGSLPAQEPGHAHSLRQSPLSWALALYGGAYVTMHVLPVFLFREVWCLLSVGDLLSILTPYVVGIPILLAWRDMQALYEGKTAGTLPTFLLLAGFALYTSGHGINLSANAIARHLLNQEGTPLFRLTYFLDEHLGHILWHAGVLVVSIGFLVPRLHDTTVRLAPVLIGGLCFGFAYCTDAIEGQTVPMMLPAAIMIPAAFWVRHRASGSTGRGNPVLLFYMMGYGVALVLFAIWLAWQGGFPQFSERGLI